MDAALRFDARELRQVLGAFVTGVTIVTTVDGHGKFHGLTANSFSSVSLDPPLVLWSQSVKSPSHSVFSATARFAVNILSEDQIGLSNRFAKSGQDKFAGLDVDVGLGGIPLLRGCSACIECTVVSSVPGGDHTIYIGEVQAIRRTARKPLVFGGGQYLVADPHDLGHPSADQAARAQSQLHAMRLGARAMARLAREFDETMALAVWGNHGPTVTTWEPASTPVSSALPLGLILPVTSTATGLAFAAHLPPAVAGRFARPELDGAAQSSAAWENRLAEVRRHGLARQPLGTFYGGGAVINALSAPVRDATGHAVLAMTAVGEARRFSADIDSVFAQALKAASDDLSRRLGYVADGVKAQIKQLAAAGG